MLLLAGQMIKCFKTLLSVLKKYFIIHLLLKDGNVQVCDTTGADGAYNCWLQKMF